MLHVHSLGHSDKTSSPSTAQSHRRYRLFLFSFVIALFVGWVVAFCYSLNELANVIALITVNSTIA